MSSTAEYRALTPPLARFEPPNSTPTWRRLALTSPLLALTCGLALAEGLRQGGFWEPDSTIVAIAAVAILAASCWRSPPVSAAEWTVVGGTVLLTTWWLARAVPAGSSAHWLPLGASLLGFAAAFAVLQPADDVDRRTVATVVSGSVALLMALGFLGLAWRWFPLAMPAQHLWRLSSSLTYSDAAGLAAGIGLLLALSLPDTGIARVSTVLCAAGLLASQSRGALLACAVGVVIVPLAQLRRRPLPLLSAAVLGVTCIATSSRPDPVWWLVPLTLVAVLAAAVRSPQIERAPTRRQWTAAAALVIPIAAAGAWAVRGQLALRALAPSDGDRRVEWSAALHQFLASPLWGAGPDHLLHFAARDGTFAYFAHNEYLQLAAGGGVVALALLLAAGAGLARLVRRQDVLTSCATAALVCWAVGGAFDFDWHLPFIGLLGGVAAGLASRRDT
ncbi:MAG: O-antigen ligase family protein [Acidimicrobiales bacterium]|nr:O-antigen ligase family protein [Acidimicrobiales bacterium]